MHHANLAAEHKVEIVALFALRENHGPCGYCFLVMMEQIFDRTQAMLFNFSVKPM